MTNKDIKLQHNNDCETSKRDLQGNNFCADMEFSNWLKICIIYHI